MSNPDDHDEYVLEAFDYYYGDYFTDAEEKFRIAIGHNSSNAIAWRGYHMALAKLGKVVDARSAIDRSLDLNSNDPESWFCLATFLDDRNLDTSAALDAYHRGLQLDPSAARMWRNLSILYKRAGNPEKSEEIIRTALRIWPDDRQCLKVLEWNLREQGRVYEAEEVESQIEASEAESKRKQEEFDRQLAEDIKETFGIDIDSYDDDDDEEIPEPYELDHITKIYEEGIEEEKDEPDPAPLVPNPPLKIDISGLFGEGSDVEDFEGSLFGDDDDEDSEDSSEVEEEDDGMDALGDLFFSD